MQNLTERYHLEKAIWSESDLETMGWHDTFIHAISFSEDSKFLLDIDYIFKWIDPVKEETYFKFWVAPCTLIFEDVRNLKITVEISMPFELEIADLHRISKDEWKIETHQGDIDFYAIGYKQYVRQNPILIHHQVLTLKERNGLSFTTQTCM
jgi:hypothetical protein